MLDQLHAGGWSVGDTAFHDVERGGIIHVVIGSNGENQIRAEDDDVSRGVAAGALFHSASDARYIDPVPSHHGIQPSDVPI